MNFPVVIISFNRPDLLAQVIQAVLAYCPSKLYIFNDGPRSKDDSEVIAINYDLVSKVNASFTIEKFFSTENLGAKLHIQKALDYFFSIEEFGIILEDDCVPSLDFFDFVTLTRQQQIESMHTLQPISGVRFNSARTVLSSKSSRLPHIWGWACTREYWSFFPRNQSQTDEIFKYFMSLKHFFFPGEKNFFYRNYATFSSFENGYLDYTLWVINKIHNLSFILPPYSLVANLGFDSRATNTYFSRLEKLMTPKSTYSLKKREISNNHLNLLSRVIYDFYNFVFCQLLCTSWYLYIKHVLKSYLEMDPKKARKGERVV